MARAGSREPAKVLLWRWRSNPLRRRTDVVEAWIGITVWFLALLGGALSGLATADVVQRHLAQQRADRHLVPAVLAEDAPRQSPVSAAGVARGRVWATVRWTPARGAARTGSALVEPGLTKGEGAKVWTDRAGRLTSEPDSVSLALQEAVLLGGLSGWGTGAVVLAGGWVLRRRLMSRRLERWGDEWARIGPQWGRRTG
ncbi:hypothetical protein AB0J38_40900 [Streptomyces sp. NPDC050095]|uniref:Rv1733c family protein n=1 Tax=unclassified Streptomyces TaxID=2593676 RepID=UPI00344A551E